ncbi:MAG: hypothetical protein U0270_05435 [Labilithrix sp.]
MTSPAAPTCQSCGAPDAGDLVICKFCRQAVSAEALKSAIPCPNPNCGTPQHRTLCRWGKQHCPVCRSWIVVSCVFCGALSPHNISNCLQCHEAFAGAPQRKAQLEQQRQHQQNMQQMNTFGNIASGFLGGMAGGAIGGAIGSGFGHHHHHDSSWSDDSSGDSGFSEGFTGESGMSDNATFDFGGDGGDSDFGGGDFGGGGSSDDF